jgi:succinate dehydrogenase / fumarate reductase iron-sulfur subunit
MSSRMILRVSRGLVPGAEGDPAFADYEVEAGEGMTVLDALETIRSGREPGLRYRHSCHHGSCGTCAAIIDGKEGLMCLSRLDALAAGGGESRDGLPVVRLEPLRKMKPLGDLAVDPEPLFKELPEGASYLRKSGLEHGGPPEEGGEYLRFEACIECGICVSACPVPEGKAFAGPAALAMADRDREERPARENDALAFAARPDGVTACEKAFACSRACPQGVAPGRRIANLRKSLG